MDQETKDAGSKLLVSVLSIITAVVASNFGVDYRSAERNAAVREEVGTLAEQNHEILQGIQMLLDEKLNQTAENSETNKALNNQILESAKKRMDLHKQEIEMLKSLQEELDKLKEGKQ